VTSYLQVTPRDPFIARDGRPFGAGNRMRPVEWLYPSVLAGSLRTLIGKQAGIEFEEADTAALRNIAIAGPLPMGADGLYFPAPKDAVLRSDPREVIPLRPRTPGGGGCDLPEGLVPVQTPEGLTEEFKPATMPAFWSAAVMASWLANSKGMNFPAPSEQWRSDPRFLAPVSESRVHTAILAGTGAAEESMLYHTAGLVLPEGVTLAARVECENGFADHLTNLDAMHPLGGERRMMRWRLGGADFWKFSDGLMSLPEKPQRLRLILCTAAIFAHGWRPGWLNKELEGAPAGGGVTLRLVGACVDRWRPISGWSLEPLKATGKPGPKKVRRAVPAGSVYFFEVMNGDVAKFIQEFWLRPVSDDPQDQRDGFGLALWGIWE